jgi:hypothetical protein
VTAYLITFLLGTAVGAAGQYFASRFTDQRRAQEARKTARSTFEQVRAAMPELIAEMKADLCKDGLGSVREFFVVSKHAVLNTRETRFSYLSTRPPRSARQNQHSRKSRLREGCHRRHRVKRADLSDERRVRRGGPGLISAAIVGDLHAELCCSGLYVLDAAAELEGDDVDGASRLRETP